MLAGLLPLRIACAKALVVAQGEGSGGEAGEKNVVSADTDHGIDMQSILKSFLFYFFSIRVEFDNIISQFFYAIKDLGFISNE
jgi:hypothetical protein